MFLCSGKSIGVNRGKVKGDTDERESKGWDSRRRRERTNRKPAEGKCGAKREAAGSNVASTHRLAKSDWLRRGESTKGETGKARGGGPNQ